LARLDDLGFEQLQAGGTPLGAQRGQVHAGEFGHLGIVVLVEAANQDTQAAHVGRLLG
jgi:hypothetical protein